MPKSKKKRNKKYVSKKTREEWKAKAQAKEAGFDAEGIDTNQPSSTTSSPVTQATSSGSSMERKFVIYAVIITILLLIVAVYMNL